MLLGKLHLYVLSILPGKSFLCFSCRRNCSLHKSAQMITTALNVGSNGSIALGNGPTYGILLAILFTHGIICSAGTAVLARLNIFYVIINSMSSLHRTDRAMTLILHVQLVLLSLPLSLCSYALCRIEYPLKMLLHCLRTIQAG